MRTILPGFSTISEFVNQLGLNGDCGPTATLGALHEVDPVRWPLTPAALHALDSDEIANGFAEANGAQNIPSLSNYLDRIGVKHTTYGYGACPIDLVHSTLKSLAGKQPVLVEWALAGALPGDEPGVHFHFSTCGGLDTGPAGDGIGGGYLWCDGDNRADDPNGVPRPPVLYTWPQIVAAQPIAMVVFEVPSSQGGPTMITIDHDASGGVTGAQDEHGGRVGAGMALAIEQHGWTGDTIAVSERPVAGVQVAILANSASPHAVLTYTPKFNVGVFDAPDLAIAMRELFSNVDNDAATVAADSASIASLQTELAAANAEIATLKAQPPVIQPPATPPDPQAEDAKAVLALLKKTLTELP